jgi:dTDP-4-amino-4,6-dideoxygalactose transaminase
VKALGLEPGSEVLAPAYHCGVEIEALESSGMVCRFYEGTRRLEPDPSELEALLGPRVRALHVTHYLGFPQDAARWRAWCDARDLLLIEDAAQAWLSSHDGRPVGSFGDVAIFSLYKTFAVPDGGAVVSKARPPDAPSKPGPGLARAARLHAAWLIRKLPIVGPLRWPYITDSPGTGGDFTLASSERAVSRTTAFLLPRLIDAAAADHRRRNYRLLLDGMGEHVPEPFRDLPDGASPYMLPIETDDKHGLLHRLARRGIAGIDFWSRPHPSLPVAQFPQAALRRARTVGLPVHQELRTSDLHRIAEAVRSEVRATRQGYERRPPGPGGSLGART